MNKERVLTELERIHNMASPDYLASRKTGGTWTVDDLLDSIRSKAEKIEKLINDDTT